MGNARQRQAAKRKNATEPVEQAGAGQANPEVGAVEAKKQRQADAEPAEDVDDGEAAVAGVAEPIDEEAPQHNKRSSEGDAHRSGSCNVGKRQDDGKCKGNGKRQEKEFEVCVNGLPFSATEDVLWTDFSECGKIDNFYLPLNEDGNPRGMAFIQYADQESVDKALGFHDSEYGGRWIQVRLSSDNTKGKGKSINAKGTEGKSKGGRGNTGFEVFVGGLTGSTTEASLRQDFADCGKIVYCRVPVNDEGSARGIAFVEFADKASVDKALEFHDTEYFGRYIQVRLSSDGSKGKGKDSKGKYDTSADSKCKVKDSDSEYVKRLGTCNFQLEVFLHGVPPSTTHGSLRKDFGKFGEIVNITLPMTPDGEARGIAFIEFKSQEACDNALTLNNARYGGRLLNVRMSAFNGFEARANRRTAIH